MASPTTSGSTPGFDGVAANGLKYGASVEIREDSNFGAGGGVYGSTTGQDRTRGLLYFRRSFGYLGTDRFGTVRVGSGDQPSSLYLIGTFENFNDGGLNGDTPGMFPGGAIAGVNFAFNDVGNMYSTTKVVYLSPQFYGVDFGLSYEPSTAAIGGDNGAGCNPSPQFGSTTLGGAQSVATPGCDDLASTSTADYARRRNTYEALVRYRGTVGPVGLAAEASYDGSGRVQDTGGHQKLEDLSYFDMGATATFAGFSVGGNYQVGRYTVLGGGGAGGLVNRGQPDASAFITGATYTLGPVIVGVQYLREFYEGDRQTATNRNQSTGAVTGLAAGQVLGGQRMDQGFAAGGTYSLAPGVSLYLSYAWAQSRQNGFNLLSGASNNANNNKLTQSIIAVGTAFAW